MSDLISRQEAIDAVSDCGICIQKIVDLPSAQKTGKWVQWNEPGCEHTECSVCKTAYDQIDLYIGGCEYPNYCPNCGARMVGDEDGC